MSVLSNLTVPLCSFFIRTLLVNESEVTGHVHMYMCFMYTCTCVLCISGID